ncbi:MAG: hypothetical protein R2729_20150 [Bryobacteraceae bacterium]
MRTPYIAEPLGQVMRRGLENQSGSASTDEASGFASALEAAGIAGNPAAVARQTRPDFAAVANSGQEAATAQQTPAAAQQDGGAVEVDRLPPIPADRSGQRYTALDDPTAAVQAELAKMGIDPSTIRFERWDDDIATIGGSHTNHLLRAYLPNGRYEDYSIEWTLRSPQVTAADIWSLMRGPAPAATSPQRWA